jgi:hypothetical protein
MNSECKVQARQLAVLRQMSFPDSIPTYLTDQTANELAYSGLRTDESENDILILRQRSLCPLSWGCVGLNMHDLV